MLWAKPLAAIATLGTGGSGGREGPTMQIGAAIGSVVGRYLSLTARERRTLMVAGIGAGISAVFRTPLGAALLAIEVLYRDDFESEALIPAVLASVIAYSVSLMVFGTEPLFGKLDHFPFHPDQLPLFLGLALVVAIGATAFEHTMAFCRRMFAKLPWTGLDPARGRWARPRRVRGADPVDRAIRGSATAIRGSASSVAATARASSRSAARAGCRAAGSRSSSCSRSRSRRSWRRA